MTTAIIKETEYKLKYSFRTLCLFENIYGQAKDAPLFKPPNDATEEQKEAYAALAKAAAFLYASILANNAELFETSPLSWEQFLDFLDDNGAEAVRLIEWKKAAETEYYKPKEQPTQKKTESSTDKQS